MEQIVEILLERSTELLARALTFFLKGEETAERQMSFGVDGHHLGEALVEVLSVLEISVEMILQPSRGGSG